MLKYTIMLLLSFSGLLANAQTIIVPADIYFADQHLLVSQRGQQEIQRQVDVLLKYPSYFKSKVDRADTYFPIIERIFQEEGLPDDFKYLTLQESGLVSDAVSTSNAVGFWQFKKEAASDYGLRINQDVDERKHIIQSTRSAARYLVKHNNVYYKNWHNTLLSYNLGLSGAKAYARPNDVNKKEMEVTERTHPYILTFLAHKVAFSGFVGRNPAPAIMLQEMTASAGKTFREMALETQTDEAELQKYNKWLSASAIPYDKTYTVLIPVVNPNQEMVWAANRTTTTSRPETNNTAKMGKREFREQNKLRVIIARRGDTKEKLASDAHISARRLLMYNDMYSHDPIVPGEAYYIQPKHSKANVPFHVVKSGEKVQQIAQQYGVKTRSVLWYNRLKANETLAEGRLLWLQRRRPSHTPIEYQKTYPESKPEKLPAQPTILAQAEPVSQAPQRSESANSETSAAEDKSMAASLEKKLNQWLGIKSKSEQVQELEVPNHTDPAAKPTESSTESPVDVAIAETNELGNASEDSLAENIDKQVESNNQNEGPLLYRRAKTTEPVAKTTLPAPSGTAQETAATSEAITAAAKPLPSVKKAETTASTKTTSTPVVKESVKETVLPVQHTGTHVVAKGETLYAISKMYQVTVDNLKDWNELGEIPLAIGQSLKVAAPPVSAANNSSVTTPTIRAQSPTATVASNSSAAIVSHTVSAGESMYQISRRYGVTIKDIMDWNNKADFNVSPGEKLVVKAKGAARN